MNITRKRIVRTKRGEVVCFTTYIRNFRNFCLRLNEVIINDLNILLPNRGDKPRKKETDISRWFEWKSLTLGSFLRMVAPYRACEQGQTGVAAIGTKHCDE